MTTSNGIHRKGSLLKIFIGLICLGSNLVWKDYLDAIQRWNGTIFPEEIVLLIVLIFTNLGTRFWFEVRERVEGTFSHCVF
jgi:hypothetical protein